MKKFEFTGEVKKMWWGVELKRIRALVEIDLGWMVVKPGDLGGWLEKETNLSHDGKCGCFLGTVDEFLAKVQQTHGDTKFAVVYRACVTVALAQIDTTPYEGEVK